MEAAIEENGAQKVFLGNSHFHKTIISLSLFTRPSYHFHFSQDHHITFTFHKTIITLSLFTRPSYHFHFPQNHHITFTLTRPSYCFHFQEISLTQGDKTKPHKQGFLSSSTVPSSYQSPSSTSAGKELMELFDRIQRQVKQRNTTFFLKYSRIVFFICLFLTLFTIVKHRLKFRNTTKMWMKRKVGSFRRGWNWLNEFSHWEKEKYI